MGCLRPPLAGALPRRLMPRREKKGLPGRAQVNMAQRGRHTANANIGRGPRRKTLPLPRLRPRPRSPHQLLRSRLQRTTVFSVWARPGRLSALSVSHS
jgi:hypothetical protein